MGTLVKKHLIRPFLSSTPAGSENPTYVQMKKATDFTRSLNAVTEDRDYIADEHPTTEVTDYKASEDFVLTMYKGENDFDMMYKMYKEKPIGDDAKRDYLLVNIFDSVTASGTTYYYAEKTNATIVLTELNSTSSQLSFTVHENGTPVIGYVEIASDGTPTFTAGAMPTAS